MNGRMIRGIVKTVTEGFIKLFSATGRTDESFEQREFFQDYGFTSRPLAGAEIIIIREGNHIVAIASDDRRYRLAVESGEVALYTDEGDKIHLKRDKTIEIVSGNKLIATVAKEVTVITKKVNITAPLVNITGNVKTTGNVSVGSGASGVIVDLTGKVITVRDGIIIDIR